VLLWIQPAEVKGFWIFLPGLSYPEFVKKENMHEIRIAEDLSAIVLDTARNGNLTKVTRINVSFGQLIQIVPDIFEFAFRETVRNTIAENAELQIEIIKVRMNCRKCGNEFHVDENLFICKVCGSVDLEIKNGKELFIKSIEGE
jgi:hydrogenase nickel incorporation protein HypA/HybF